MVENEKIIIVQRTAKYFFRTRKIWQYDVGHILRFDGFNLPFTFQVHFATSKTGEAQTQVGQDGICEVPPEYTQNSGAIYAWVYEATEDTGLTKHEIEIPIEGRARPTNQEPTPAEQSVIDQTIAASNYALEKAQEAKQAAETAKTDAETAKGQAEDAATRAALSATDANSSRESADQSATNAWVSERNARASAQAAAQSASAAAQSASNASGSASAAAGSASAASTKAGEAASSATAAAGSAATAGTKAGEAASSASAAAQKAQEAASSAGSASQSATNADTARQAAETAKTGAETARQEAQTAASNAAGSASSASGYATNAAGSASAAAQSATAASNTVSGAVATINAAKDSAVTAVQNKGDEVLDSIPADYSALTEEVEAIRSEADAHEQYAEETYAKQDGYYQDMAVGTAEQLVATEAVEDQEPYHLRPSGGSADIGNRENQKAIVGVSLPWNQLVRDEASDNTTEFADIVTVDDAVVDNAAVKVKIEPVQDLHGYDAPWPAGGGKNKAKITAETTQKPSWYPSGWLGTSVNNKHGITQTRGYQQGSAGGFHLTNISAGTYTFSLTFSGTTQQCMLFVSCVDGDGNVTTIVNNLGMTQNSTRYKYTFTVPDGMVDVVFRPTIWSATDSYDLEDIQIEEGSTATAFAPYSNECPITGWTGANVWGTGINVWGGGKMADDMVAAVNDASKCSKGTDSDGAYVKLVASNAIGKSLSGGLKFKPNTQYTFVVKGKRNNTNKQSLLRFKYTDGTTSEIILADTVVANTIYTNAFASSPNKTIENVFGYYASGESYLYYADCGLFEGVLTADQFTPYQGSTYPITFPSESGTVYGGELTVNKDGTGQFVVDRAEVDLGSLTWRKTSSNIIFYSQSLNAENAVGNLLCSHYEYGGDVVSNNAAYYKGDCLICLYNGSDRRIYIRDDSLADYTIEQFREAMLGVQCVYPLITPLTYDLTAPQVQTILGTNNVWSDAGQLSLTYTGTNEHLTLTEGRKYLTRLSGTDVMVTGAGQELVAAKGTDNVFDLTKLFGTAVADYVYQQGAGYFRRWFPNSLYEYNTDGLEHVEGLVSHDTVGFNLWDEEWESGSYGSDGSPSADNSRIRSKNKIKIIPGATYFFNVNTAKYAAGTWVHVVYFDDGGNVVGNANPLNQATFNVPSNATHMLFNTSSGWGSGTTYDHDICISLVNSGSRNGEYEPYVKHSYPIDSSVTLRGIPKVGANGVYWDGDRYLPDGTIERRYGVVDMGTLNWNHYVSSGRQMFRAVVSDLLPEPSSAVIIPAISGKYRSVSRNITWIDDDIAYWGQNEISIIDNDYTDAATFKAAMSGVMLVYELATPTTEQADPYRELQIVDDWGTEEFVSESLVPVGHETEYPANLRDKLQHLPDLASGNGIYIVKQTDSEMELMRLPDMPTANGNYRLKLNVASGSPTFSWEVVT